jgi:hypothetical protein
MAFVVERAQSLSGAEAAVLELAEGDDVASLTARADAALYDVKRPLVH